MSVQSTARAHTADVLDVKEHREKTDIVLHRKSVQHQ
jgi:hypothetical protein